jgi:hypothetical protein
VSHTQTIDRDRQERIIAEAIRDRRQLTITYSLPDGWRRCKAVFLSGSTGSNETIISLGLPKGDAVLPLPPVGATIGGTFRLGHKKCMFSAGVRACRRQPTSILLTLNWPEYLSQLQRRAFERAAPPRGNVIAVRFWREDDGADPSAAQRDVRHGQLEDISAGGMRMKVADTERLQLERAYKCVFTPRPGKPAFVLDAILRHREAVEQGRASLGFQFVGLEMSDEGLRTLDRLARLVGHFQRTHPRRSD